MRFMMVSYHQEMVVRKGNIWWVGGYVLKAQLSLMPHGPGRPRWQAEGGAGVGGNEVGHGLRHCLDLDLGHGHGLSLGCGLGRGHDGHPHGPGRPEG